MKQVLGIDVGATGIKGGIVDIDKGMMITERIKYDTPKPATPKSVLDVIEQIAKDFDWKNKPLGIGFPAIIKNGRSYSASNIDSKFIGFKLLAHLNKKVSDKIALLNDADAAGIAEMVYGRGKDADEELIILLTLGTGIGSAIFLNGELLPNTELGQLYYKKGVTENYAANSVREKNDLSFKEWSKELDAVIKHIDFLFSPDIIILGGGVSKKYSKYEDYLSLAHKIVPAKLLNHAGIIGAAYAAHKQFG